METLYVYNPDTGSFVQADEWLKDADPKRAQLIGIKTDRGMLVLDKKDLGDYSFAKAQLVAESNKVEGFDQGFRCPTRRETIDIQDAIEDGLHDLIDAIGGDNMIGDWIWTSERFAEDGWFARRSNAYGAWIFYGTSGYLSITHVYSSSRCRAVTLLPTEG